MIGRRVQKAGLLICQEYPYLAATPDGYVGKEHTLEVKCPYTGRYDKIEANDKFGFLDDELQLKRNHKYYDQIQGQMFISKRSCCYFVVYTFIDFKVLTVKLDREYCTESLLPKLSLFYDKHFLPYVARALV